MHFIHLKLFFCSYCLLFYLQINYKLKNRCFIFVKLLVSVYCCCKLLSFSHRFPKTKSWCLIVLWRCLGNIMTSVCWYQAKAQCWTSQKSILSFCSVYYHVYNDLKLHYTLSLPFDSPQDNDCWWWNWNVFLGLLLWKLWHSTAERNSSHDVSSSCIGSDQYHDYWLLNNFQIVI